MRAVQLWLIRCTKVARLTAMDAVEFEGERPTHEIGRIRTGLEQLRFLFIHIKRRTAMLKMKALNAKVHEIEAVTKSCRHLAPARCRDRLATTAHRQVA